MKENQLNKSPIFLIVWLSIYVLYRLLFVMECINGQLSWNILIQVDIILSFCVPVTMSFWPRLILCFHSPFCKSYYKHPRTMAQFTFQPFYIYILLVCLIFYLLLRILMFKCLFTNDFKYTLVSNFFITHYLWFITQLEGRVEFVELSGLGLGSAHTKKSSKPGSCFSDFIKYSDSILAWFGT